MQDVIRALPQEEREQLRAAMSYEEGSVGALMDFDQLTVRPDATLGAVTKYLRALDELPGQSDQLFVLDLEQRLQGTLPLARLIVSDLERAVGQVMVPEGVRFHPEQKAEDAAKAFERYDLVSAPVTDHFGTPDRQADRQCVVDYVRAKSEQAQLAEVGLREEEDVFASVWNRFRNRWAWLAINLVTAFIASRVIGAFEGSIEKLVAPRGAHADRRRHRRKFRQPDDHDDRPRARARPDPGHILEEAARQGTWRRNGERRALGNAAGRGCLHALRQRRARRSDGARDDPDTAACRVHGRDDPYLRVRFGRDPAVGSSVLITACTDSGGFFIFLGLATLFLL
jgi:magnesium transporter